MPYAKEDCRRCGNCCRNGGPALHDQDRHLVTDGHLHLDQLITIRKGEKAVSPAAGAPKTITHELIKIQGRGGGWDCLFFNPAEQSCTTYDHRPLECHLFLCRIPAALHAIMEKELLQRRDLLHPNDPVREIMERHDQQCPPAALFELLKTPHEDNHAAILSELNRLVRLDMSIRQEAVSKFTISAGLELFLFGRPHFILLAPHGFSPRQGPNGLEVVHRPPQV